MPRSRTTSMTTIFRQLISHKYTQYVFSLCILLYLTFQNHDFYSQTYMCTMNICVGIVSSVVIIFVVREQCERIMNIACGQIGHHNTMITQTESNMSDTKLILNQEGNNNIIMLNTVAENNAMKSLVELTKEVLQDHNDKIVKINRKAVSVVVNHMLKFNVAVLSGAVGEGKTWTALEAITQIRSHFNTTVTVVKVYTPLDWQTVKTSENPCIISIEDMFGQAVFSEHLYQSWQPFLTEINDYVERKKVTVLITSRCYVLDEAITFGAKHSDRKKNVFLERDNIFNLSAELALTPSERRRLIERHLDLRPDIFKCNSEIDAITMRKAEPFKSVISYSTIDDITYMTCNPSMGFPLCLEMFLSRNEFLKQGEQYFRRPQSKLVENIQRNTSREQFFALVFCLVRDNYACAIDLSSLDPKHISADERRRLQVMAKACKVLFHYFGELLSILDNAIDSLEDSYLKVSVNEKSTAIICTPKHHSIAEAVCITFGKKNPRLALTYCSDRIIIEHTTVDKEEVELQPAMYVRPSQYEVLSERIASIVTKDVTSFQTLKPFRNEDYVRRFFDYMMATNKLDIMFEKIGSSLCGLPPSVTSNALFLEELFNAKFESFLTKSYGKEHFLSIIQNTLVNAICQGNLSSVRVLLSHGAQIDKCSVIHAAGSGNEHLFREILQMQLNVKFDRLDQVDIPREVLPALESSLKEAIRTSGVEIVQLLLQKVPIDKTCISYALNFSNAETISCVLTECECPVELLNQGAQIACSRGDIAVLECFLCAGATIDTNCVQEFVGNICSRTLCTKKDLEQILQKRYWTVHELSVALLTACNYQHRCICKILHEKGGQFLENSLQAVSEWGTKRMLLYVLDSVEWSKTQLTKAINKAVFHNRIKIANILRDHAGQFDRKSLKKALLAFVPKLSTVKYVMNNCRVSCDEISDGLACICHRLCTNEIAVDDEISRIIQYLLNKGAVPSECLMNSIKSGSVDPEMRCKLSQIFQQHQQSRPYVVQKSTPSKPQITPLTCMMALRHGSTAP